MFDRLPFAIQFHVNPEIYGKSDCSTGRAPAHFLLYGVEPGTKVESESKGAPAGTSTSGTVISISTSPFPTISLIAPGLIKTLIKRASSAPLSPADKNRTVARSIPINFVVVFIASIV